MMKENKIQQFVWMILTLMIVEMFEQFEPNIIAIDIALFEVIFPNVNFIISFYRNICCKMKW